MTHPYLPHTLTEKEAMLSAIGVANVEDLFVTIPEKFRTSARAETNQALIPALSEQEVMEKLGAMAELNLIEGGWSQTGKRYVSFLGGGANRHYVPALVNYLTQRGEFLTSYTPYQPEVSQGNLQALFEFQTMVAELAGLDLANAGLYDGATALVEAVLLALRSHKDRSVIVLAASLSERSRECVRTIVRWLDGVQVVEVPWIPGTGMLNIDNLKNLVSDRGSEIAAVCVGYPNFFGVMEDLSAISSVVKPCGAVFVSNTCEALALSLFRSPGSQGVDLSTGDLQSFGVSPSFGGPWCGFLSARGDFLRQMPGRLIGETVDRLGGRGFVLTLSTREQHIRREKATSNVCTNNALLALSVAIYLSLHGPEGLKQLAEVNLARRVYLEKELAKVGFPAVFSAPHFNEFVIDLTPALRRHSQTLPDFLEMLVREWGIVLGPQLGGDFGVGSAQASLANAVIVSVTETNSRESLDRLVKCLSQ